LVRALFFILFPALKTRKQGKLVKRMEDKLNNKLKKHILGFIMFIVLFTLSLDFWGWNIAEPLFFGIPLWLYYLFFLTVITSVFFYIIAKYLWSDE
jgi:hypothetical protein